MKKDKVINEIILGIVFLFLFSSLFFVGFYRSFGSKMIYLTAILLMILQRLKKNWKLSFSKTDFFLLCFCFCILIPCVNKTCVNSINLTFSYFLTFLSSYVISKIGFSSYSELKDNKFHILILLFGVVTILCNILYFMNPELFQQLGFFNHYGDYYDTSVYRLYSFLMYPNAYALLISVLLLLDYYYLLNDKKIVYFILSILFTFGLFATISKTILLFDLCIFLFLLFYYRKKKEKWWLLLKSVFLSIISGLILVKYFRIYYFNSDFLFFLVLVLMVILFASFLFCKLKKRGLFLFLLLFFISIPFGYRNLEIRHVKAQKSVFLTDIMSLEKKKEYEITFDISIKNATTTKARIMCLYLDHNHEALQLIQEYELKKGKNHVTFQFTSKDEFEYYYVSLFNLNYDNDYEISSIQVKEIKSGEIVVYPLDHFLFPYQYYFSFQTLKYDKASVIGRGQIYLDCFKQIQKHPFSGYGSEAFRYFLTQNNYSHFAYEEHSFLLKIWLEFGLISLCIFLFLILRNFMFYQKIKKKEYHIYLFATLCLLIASSSIDFTFSYFLFFILFLWCSFFLEKEYQKSSKNKVMFVASAGGHLTELLKIKDLFSQYDSILITEKNCVSKSLELDIPHQYLFYCSRFYPVKYFFFELFNIFLSIFYILKYHPDLIYTTGAHTAVWLCYCGYLFDTKIVFVEVYDRIYTPTLSGRLLYPIADTFLVQHEELLQYYKKGKYVKGVYE